MDKFREPLQKERIEELQRLFAVEKEIGKPAQYSPDSILEVLASHELLRAKFNDACMFHSNECKDRMAAQDQCKALGDALINAHKAIANQSRIVSADPQLLDKINLIAIQKSLEIREAECEMLRTERDEEKRLRHEAMRSLAQNIEWEKEEKAERGLLRKMLQQHHDWHLAQTEAVNMGGVDVVPADAYAESGMCADTAKALSASAADESDTIAANLWMWLNGSDNKTTQAILELWIAKHGYASVAEARDAFDKVSALKANLKIEDSVREEWKTEVSRLRKVLLELSDEANLHTGSQWVTQIARDALATKPLTEILPGLYQVNFPSLEISELLKDAGEVIESEAINYGMHDYVCRDKTKAAHYDELSKRIDAALRKGTA